MESTCDRVAVVRGGRLVHEQCLAELRRNHRITARLAGAWSDIPADLTAHATLVEHRGDRVVIESGDSLAPLLGWLATLPLDEVQIEPVGLGAVYDRFHRGPASG